jgi:uncharacterized membrane protein YesL
MKNLWKRFKKYLFKSTLLGVLFFPMNVLSRIDYASAWNSPHLGGKICLAIVVLVIWNFMCFLLDACNGNTPERND